MLIYIERKLVDIWKKDIFKNLELKFPIVEDFLTELKKEFGSRGNKLMKVAELKKIEQRFRIIQEFVQEFRKVML